MDFIAHTQLRRSNSAIQAALRNDVRTEGTLHSCGSWEDKYRSPKTLCFTSWENPLERTEFMHTSARSHALNRNIWLAIANSSRSGSSIECNCNGCHKKKKKKKKKTRQRCQPGGASFRNAPRRFPAKPTSLGGMTSRRDCLDNLEPAHLNLKGT
jgi:hypothetical protein